MRISVLVASLLVSACNGAGAPSQALLPTAESLKIPASGSYLFVANCCGALNHGDVTVYDPGETKIARHITQGDFDPMDIVVDRAATLYVLDQSEGGPGGVTVTEYDRGSHLPSRRIDGLYWATTLAVDRSNDLFVADCNTCVSSGEKPAAAADSVTEYAPGQTNPSRTITQGIHHPVALALDAGGNLYVSNNGFNDGSKHLGAAITVYAPGSRTPLRKITQGILGPGPIALNAGGDLFVLTGNAKAKLVEYAAGSSKVVRKINAALAGFHAMAVDASGTLYVSNWPNNPSGPGWISIYATGRSSPEYKIVRGINQPVALALDGSGNLYVANLGPSLWGHVSIYAPNGRAASRSLVAEVFGPPRSIAFGGSY